MSRHGMNVVADVVRTRFTGRDIVSVLTDMGYQSVGRGVT